MRHPVPAAVLLCALALTLPAAAQARPNYCSPTGDYCTSVVQRGGKITLRLATFSFRGPARLCVTGPDGGTDCKRSGGVGPSPGGAAACTGSGGASSGPPSARP